LGEDILENDKEENLDGEDLENFGEDELENDQEENLDDVYMNLADVVEAEIDPERHQQLLDQILQSKKKSEKVRVIPMPSEGQFNHNPMGSTKLSINDLIKSYPSGDIAKIKEQLTDVEDKNYKMILDVPKVERQRELRKAQLEVTVNEVSEWTDTVNTLRNAKTIQFPLKPSPKVEISTRSLANSLVPTTSLEQTIEKTLFNTTLKGVNDLNTLPLNDRKEHQNMDQLIKLKRLMFYHQKKLKWQKKYQK